MPPLRYEHFTPALEAVDKVIVDGSPCGEGLHLSHWPGNRTPAEFRADLSAEIALRFAASPRRAAYLEGRSVVTNDHYDTDGVLAAWIVIRPEDGLAHAAEAVAAAEAGDFYEFTSARAVQFDLVAQAFGDARRSPVSTRGMTSRAEWYGAVTSRLVDELPGLLHDPGRYRELWEADYARMLEEFALFSGGSAQAREWPVERLTTIQTPKPLDHFARNLHARGTRILEAVPGEGGTRYWVYYREYLWYDVLSRPVTPRHRLLRAAERLNALEPAGGGGTWVVTEWTPALFHAAAGDGVARVVTHKEPAGPSALALDVVEGVVREELRALDEERPGAVLPALAHA